MTPGTDETKWQLFVDNSVASTAATAANNAATAANAAAANATAATSYIADEYDATQTYAVGDYVIHDAKLYRCNTAITTVEVWTAAHWTEIQATEAIADISEHVDQAVDMIENALPVRSVSSNNGMLTVPNGAFALDELLFSFEDTATSSFTFYHGHVNMYTGGTNTSNGYVANSYLASNGVETANTNYNISEYIPVEANTVYLVSHAAVSNTFHYCYYNASHEYLGQQGYNNRRYHYVATPANAAYVRLSLQKTYPNNYIGIAESYTVELPEQMTDAIVNVTNGTVINTSTGTVSMITSIPIDLYNDANYFFHLNTLNSTAKVRVPVTVTEDTIDNLQSQIDTLDGKTDGFQAFQNTLYYRNVRWGATAFERHYHSAYTDDEVPLFTSTTTAAQYYQMFNTLVSTYTGYAASHEMGLASDGTTMMYYYTFNPIAPVENSYKRPKIIITACQHGFEKVASFGIYWFIKNMLEDWESNPFLDYVRNHVQLVVMPLLNPYGFDHNVYFNKAENGVNLNRNWPTTGWTSGSGTSYGGPSAGSEVETQYAMAVIQANLDALWLCDYHNNGQVAPDAPTGYLWHSFAQVTYDDPYFAKAFHAARWHIDDTTGHLYKDYPDYCSYVQSGQITDNNAPSHAGLIVAYAREQGIMAETMEGGAAFIGDDDYGRYNPQIHHMNADLIGNWVRCLLGTYSRYVY